MYRWGSAKIIIHKLSSWEGYFENSKRRKLDKSKNKAAIEFDVKENPKTNVLQIYLSKNPCQDYPLSINYGPEIGDFFRPKNPSIQDQPQSLSQAGKKSRPEFDSKRNFAIPIADLQNYESKKVLNAFSRLQDNPFFMDWLSNRDLRVRTTLFYEK